MQVRLINLRHITKVISSQGHPILATIVNMQGEVHADGQLDVMLQLIRSMGYILVGNNVMHVKNPSELGLQEIKPFDGMKR